uniref:Uncharacterized protein n=1 Tax=Oryza meridionalis TaxID=40149 RepID=A0A0E0DAY0_9ORYZ
MSLQGTGVAFPPLIRCPGQNHTRKSSGISSRANYCGFYLEVHRLPIPPNLALLIDV